MKASAAYGTVGLAGWESRTELEEGWYLRWMLARIGCDYSLDVERETELPRESWSVGYSGAELAVEGLRDGVGKEIGDELSSNFRKIELSLLELPY